MSVCFCISGDPVEDDPRQGNSRTWRVTMCDAPAKEPLYCAYGAFCTCCAVMSARYWALEGDMTKYKCCQDKIKLCGLPYADCEKQGSPWCCLCLEAYCCPGIAMSATRFYLMDKKNIRSDECDNKLIRINNFIQVLSCICNIAAAATQNEAIDQIAHILDIIADIIFLSIMGCMTAQVRYETRESLQTAKVKDIKGGGQVHEVTDAPTAHEVKSPVVEATPVKQADIPVVEATSTSQSSGTATQVPVVETTSPTKATESPVVETSAAQTSTPEATSTQTKDSPTVQ